jgi:hypothetical protein
MIEVGNRVRFSKKKKLILQRLLLPAPKEIRRLKRRLKRYNSNHYRTKIKPLKPTW